VKALFPVNIMQPNVTINVVRFDCDLLPKLVDHLNVDLDTAERVRQCVPYPATSLFDTAPVSLGDFAGDFLLLGAIALLGYISSHTLRL
jgi:hypothetical protein